jgi:hypothetical protein
MEESNDPPRDPPRKREKKGKREKKEKVRRQRTKGSLLQPVDVPPRSRRREAINPIVPDRAVGKAREKVKVSTQKMTSALERAEKAAKAMDEEFAGWDDFKPGCLAVPQELTADGTAREGGDAPSAEVEGSIQAGAVQTLPLKEADVEPDQ